MVLGVNDLPKVLDELYYVRKKWYDIGLRLNVPAETLEKIKATDHGDCNSCLREVLVFWLRSGKATWLALCEALCHRTIGQGKLADALQAKYHTSVKEKYQTTEPQSGSDTSRGTSAKKNTSKNPTGLYQTASKTQEKPSATTKVGEAGTSRAKKRPSDASGPTVTKKPKSSVKLPDSLAKDDFVRQPPADRLCVKCSHVPFNPQRSKCCNQLYCEPCSKKRIRKCGIHKSELQYTPDKYLYTTIQKLTIKCPHRIARRCNWKGTVLNLKNHLPDCDVGGHTKDKGMAGPSHVNTEKDTKSHSKPMKNHPGVQNQIQINIGVRENDKKKQEKDSSTAVDTEGTAGDKHAGESSRTRKEHETSTTTCKCSCLPLNMIMKPVSEYQKSTSMSKIWLSPPFLSHQLGYKLCLAVEVQPQPSLPLNDNLQLNVAIEAAPGDQPGFVKFPCVGYATVLIMNPQHNKGHIDISFGFSILSDESDKFMPSSVPNEYVLDDCLFFHVEKIELGADYKPWLLDPHHELEIEDSDSIHSETESESS